MSNKPYIICHMLSSIDGKITFGKVNDKDSGIYAFGDYMPLYNKTQEELKVRAIMCGRVTMQEFEQDTNASIEHLDVNESILNEDNIITNENEGYFFVVDTKGLLRWKENFIELSSEYLSIHKWNLVTLVTEKTPKQYLAYLRSKNISYIFVGEQEVDFRKAFEKIKNNFAIERLAVEGGGSINGSVINEDLIDEISLLFCPFVINNEAAPSLFYHKLSEVKLHNFELQSHDEIDKNVLWLRYKKNS